MKPLLQVAQIEEESMSFDNLSASLTGEMSGYEKPCHPAYPRLAENDDQDNAEESVEGNRQEALARLIDLGLVVRAR